MDLLRLSCTCLGYLALHFNVIASVLQFAEHLFNFDRCYQEFALKDIHNCLKVYDQFFSASHSGFGSISCSSQSSVK
jgi:hypothetical protein